MLTCDQIHELEPGYAIGILSDVELGNLRDHLLTCERHPELAGLRAAAEALAYAVAEREPPARLRERVLADRGVARLGSSRGVPFWLGSAAVVVVIAAVVAVIAVTWPGDGDVFVKSFTTHDDIEVELVADFSRASSTVTFAHLPALGPGQQYTTWAIRDGVWLSMGSFTANANGWWSGEFAFRMQPGDSLCLTSGDPSDQYSRSEPLFIEPL